MVKPRPQKPPPGKTNFASCILATTFVIFIIILLLIAFFTLINPKPPSISVNSINLPFCSISNNTVTLTFSLYASVSNPNHVAFSHYDSSLQLLHAGNQIGFMYIPASKVAAGQNQLMAATFSVRPFPLGAVPTGLGSGSGGEMIEQEMEIESRMKLVGKVRILHFFAHNLEATSDCRVTVSVSDGSVSGFRC